MVTVSSRNLENTGAEEVNYVESVIQLQPLHIDVCLGPTIQTCESPSLLKTTVYKKDKIKCHT